MDVIRNKNGVCFHDPVFTSMLFILTFCLKCVIIMKLEIIKYCYIPYQENKLILTMRNLID